MDLGTAFSFPFEDEDWVKKLVIAGLLVFSGVGIIAIIGWSLEITRRVRRGDTAAFPDWSEFGTYLIDGLKLILVGLVWSLPIVLFSACLALLSAFSGDISRDAEGVIALVASLGAFCIGVPWGILVGVLLPAAVGHYAATGMLGKAMNPITAFKIVRANPAGFLIVWLLGGIVVSVLSSIGSLLCVVGFFPAVAYALAITGHMTGQAYKGAEAAGLTL